MARKRRFKSKSRRKSRRKRRKKSKMQKLTLSKWPTSFPDTLLVKQRYMGSYAWTAASSASQIFALNNLNDVDLTAAGNQYANMSDQIRVLYNRWKVYAAKVVVKCVNLSSTEAVACTLNFQNSATPVSYRETLENPYSKNWCVGIESGGKNIVTRSMYMSLKKLAGERLIGHAYDGSELVDPSIIFHGIVQGDAMGGGNITMDVEIRLTLYVRYYHRQLVPISTGPA